MLQEFRDVFLDEIPRLPPKRDIDFTIDLEHTKVARAEDATTRVVGEEVYQAECVTLRRTSYVCEKEIWYTLAVYSSQTTEESH